MEIFRDDTTLKFEILDPFLSYHNHLLEKYFNHPDTPDNNSSHKKLKTHLYVDNDEGICIIGIDNDEIVCMTSAFLIQYGDTTVVKKSHRLHIRSDYTQRFFTIMCKFFEPMFYNWLEKIGVYHIISTVNEGKEKNLTGTTRLHFLRSHSYHYLNDIGKQFLHNQWVIYPYMIYENNTWQYFYWSSLSSMEWNPSWRDTKPISDEFKQELDSKFTSKREDGAWTFTLKR